MYIAVEILWIAGNYKAKFVFCPRYCNIQKIGIINKFGLFPALDI